MDEKITKILSGIPDQPGVYIMKNSSNDIIYIGKAVSLIKRVSSYFQKNIQDKKTAVLVSNIDSIEYIVTSNEIEALLLENNLIKTHKPRFNIRLKDDKNYPYIAVTFSEDYPRIIYTRMMTNDRNRYFGPYTDSSAAKNGVNLVNDLFKLKRCTKKLPLKNGERPCINNQIGKCSGVCTNLISKDEYLEIIKSAVLFLEGENQHAVEFLTEKMNSASAAFEFEKAAKLRDMIFNIQKISFKQNISLSGGFDRDYAGIKISDSEAVIILFEFRNGILCGRKITIIDNIEYSTVNEILQSFIIDYYKRNRIPLEIFVEHEMSDSGIIKQYLSTAAEKKVFIKKIKSDEDKSILNLIHKNIDAVIINRKSAGIFNEKTEGLNELRRMFDLPDFPEKMVCFDISNFQGTNAVASMAAFKNGVSDRSRFRKFKIKGYTEANDPGMIHEAVARFLQNVTNGEEEKPDLIIIDGGPTQLKRAIEARDALGMRIPVISIAKKFEELYFSPDEQPVRPGYDSPALKIIQNIRDQTHDFGVKYHRILRSKNTLTSDLDRIEGIGEKKRNILLKKFKSIDAVKSAQIEELSGISGISRTDAEKIYAFFH
ncbi:MAG: excinuclease ABC subunit UvrC [Spirochaetes bacterium]|nr:excinuclease ABC subunit UvrC [Spirochaetota bacterium]